MHVNIICNIYLLTRRTRGVSLKTESKCAHFLWRYCCRKSQTSSSGYFITIWKKITTNHGIILKTKIITLHCTRGKCVLIIIYCIFCEILRHLQDFSKSTAKIMYFFLSFMNHIIAIFFFQLFINLIWRVRMLCTMVSVTVKTAAYFKCFNQQAYNSSPPSSVFCCSCFT